MLTYSEQVRNELLDEIKKVETQIRMNELFQASEIPFQYNSEGSLVYTG